MTPVESVLTSSFQNILFVTHQSSLTSSLHTQAVADHTIVFSNRTLVSIEICYDFAIVSAYILKSLYRL